MFERFRQDGRGRGSPGSDAQTRRRGTRLQYIQFLFGDVRLGADGSRQVRQHFAGFRGLDSPCVPIEKPNPMRKFELPHDARDRRLRDVSHSRRAVDAPLFDDIEEKRNVVMIHDP
jgi:hypothetical protein